MEYLDNRYRFIKHDIFCLCNIYTNGKKEHQK